jgi:hypothetical protein
VTRALILLDGYLIAILMARQEHPHAAAVIVLCTAVLYAVACIVHDRKAASGR